MSPLPSPVVTLDVETVGPAPLDPRARQHMVPMRDGVASRDRRLPARGRRARSRPCSSACPTTRTAATAGCRSSPRHFIARGYAFVPQDVRGKFRSEGEPLAFVNEVPDGYDTIEWIARQPWSNGDVGMWGDSYYGFTQWAAVACGHPALKAIVPRVTIADLDSLAGGRDAALRRALPGRVLDRPQHQRVAARLEPAAAGRGVRRRLRGARAALGVVRLRARALARRARGRRSSRAAHPFDVLRIPTLHGVGWFDNITPPHMLDYEALVRDPATAPSSTCTRARPTTRTTSSSTCRSPSRDDHGRTTTRWSGCCPATSGPALDFFDAFLTGARDPAAVPRVRWHLRARRLARVADAGRRPGAHRAAPVPRRRRARRR